MLNQFLESANRELDNISPEVTLIGNAAMESMVVLTDLRSKTTASEFKAIATECGTALELYDVVKVDGLVNDTVGEIAKVNDSMSPAATLTAVKLSETANDPLFEEYSSAAKKAADSLASIKEKYGEQATTEAATILTEAARKASFIKTDMGKTVATKLGAM